MKKIKFKPSRMLAAMACIVLVMLLGDATMRTFVTADLESIVVNQGRFLQAKDGITSTVIGYDAESEISTVPVGIADAGYSQKTVTAEDIFRGLLVPAADDKPILAGNDETAVNLSDYKNECYSVSDDSLMLNAEAISALNGMMQGYVEFSALTNFMVYGTNSTYDGADSPCPRKYADSASGNTIDVAIIGYGTVMTYDGMDTEGWVVQNCTSYGYIVRYPEEKANVTSEDYCPWHLRYVGQPHALIMNANNMCLEEYVKYVKGYTFDNPLQSSVGEDLYEIYGVPSMGDVTYINVPSDGDIDISGDGESGYIVTVKK